jgi:8-amino-7-oxononanoate synthase
MIVGKDQALEQLRRELEEDRSSGLWRTLDAAPEGAVALCTNDYLGLSRHPEVIRAAHEALDSYGTSARAARTLYGTTACHLDLEKALADFKSTEACLLFPAGYMAALGAISTMAGPDDVVLLDRYCHSCLFDGARLSQATIRIFRHNDPNDLADILSHERRRGNHRSLHIVTESLFSMEGDLSPLPEIVACAREYDAFLIVDEAHANGLYGPKGAGRIAELGLGKDVDLQMGTLGKSLASSGGFIAGPADQIDFLRQRARPFLFTTAAPPATAAAARAALQLVTGPEGEKRRCLLEEQMARAAEIFSDAVTVPSPIITLPVTDEAAARDLQQALAQKGILVSAARYPTVPRGAARLRLSLTAHYDLETVREALTTVYQDWKAHSVSAPRMAGV